MHTEDEAKTKWCPFARAVGYLSDGEGLVDTASNRHPDAIIMEQVRCIASQCAAWRWGEPASATRFHSAGGGGADEDGVSMTWKKERRITADERRGYCGLAGRDG